MVKVMRSIVRGPLAPHVTGLAVELLERGYTRSAAAQHICFVAHLDRWLLAEDLGVHDLSESTIKRYLTERRAAGYVLYRSSSKAWGKTASTESGSPEDVAPAGEGQVRGEDQRGAFVAGRDELEEQVRGVLFERYVADLVDDRPVAGRPRSSG